MAWRREISSTTCAGADPAMAMTNVTASAAAILIVVPLSDPARSGSIRRVSAERKTVLAGAFGEAGSWTPRRSVKPDSTTIGLRNDRHALDVLDDPHRLLVANREMQLVIAGGAGGQADSHHHGELAARVRFQRLRRGRHDPGPVSPPQRVGDADLSTGRCLL